MIASASSMAGNAKSTSVTRPMTWSQKPPR